MLVPQPECLPPALRGESLVMGFTSTILLSLIASGSVAFASPAADRSSRWIVHDTRVSAPASFTNSGRAPADSTIRLRINVGGNNLAALEEKLNTVADPSSSTFRQWLSKEEVEAFATPSTEATDAVNSWLDSHGVTSEKITPAGDWISVTVPVSKAEEMLNTQYDVYTHSSGAEVIRTLEVSLPHSVASVVKAIHPSTSFNGPTKGGRSPVYEVKARSVEERAAQATCSTSMTPACLQALYNIPTTAATNKSNSMGVTGYGDQYANQADLTLFLKKYRTDMSSSTAFTLTSVDGGTNSQTASQAGVEANLDIQYTVGLATNVPAYFVSVGDNTKDGADEGFLDTINALLGETAPPLALSTSYGLDVESDLSLSLSVALCNSYMQLTSRGVSILFATGDGGVASTPGVSCTNKAFPPTFPTCPYVTLVGATQNQPEKGASLSAGGFSNYFAQTSWQASAVSKYLTFLGTTYSGKYNASGRAYPDVSSIGYDVQVYVDKSVESVDGEPHLPCPFLASPSDHLRMQSGTSCSSPIFTSVVALLNDALLNAGKPVLGFLNPWLYANPGAFNDITTGSNPGCGTNGFSATTGWDPVTGLGSPNFALLKTAAGL
ncbi:subtilisin-like protein [Clavulina sp. PMI_390]|nr:subtilisin-like protein [Clavulina sp. PMI_390]